MEINTIMSQQLLELQQTIQMSVLNKAMHADTEGLTQLLASIPEAQHPYLGKSFDVSV
ncbi:putative motility protein [Kurthia sibirica]|uniref:Motility protein n=1 Tax=Kurthia sibirica TaxID=202750 RepID=A0A2U3AP42_9BACL|nr:putative motility protein [Kurthia sibirica]PWI26312.1 hypothetical protein DEX24_02965 [Kurthia sibirica]GEK35019.1 hypothetical protein KSI01_25520 [Kurthia sibirica]